MQFYWTDMYPCQRLKVHILKWQWVATVHICTLNKCATDIGMFKLEFNFLISSSKEVKYKKPITFNTYIRKEET